MLPGCVLCLPCDRTTAAIEPPTLIPSLTPSESISSKKADFGLVLSLGFKRERALCQCGILTLNQTEYEPVRYSPIAVSIETKVPGEGWDDAQLQMSTWMLAHIAKLKELCLKAGAPEVRVPSLPVIVVQGHEWNFLYIEDCDTHVVSGQPQTPKRWNYSIAPQIRITDAKCRNCGRRSSLVRQPPYVVFIKSLRRFNNSWYGRRKCTYLGSRRISSSLCSSKTGRPSAKCSDWLHDIL